MIRAVALSELQQRAGQLPGVTPAVMAAWTKDQTLSPVFYFRDGDRAYLYHPAAVAAFELGQTLAKRIGPKNG
jgi:hypothetical protein